MFEGLLGGRFPGAAFALSFTTACAWTPTTTSAEEPAQAVYVSDDDRESTEQRIAVIAVGRAVQRTTRQIAAGNATLEFGDSSDWVLTTSGEWVRGNVDSMRNDIMSFDSDEFGSLEAHMRDVAVIHAPHADTYVFDDRSSLRGPAIITRDQVAVETGEGVELRPRNELWAIVEGGVRELDRWSTRLNLGMSANRGNSNQIDFNMGFRLTREDRRTLTQLAYDLNLGRADGDRNVSRHIGGFLTKVWLIERFYLNPLMGQLLSDKFQGIRFRAQPTTGAGVRFLDLPKVWWNFTTGPGYEYLELFDPLAIVQNPQHEGLVRFATRARFDFSGDVYMLMNWVSNLVFT